jgi:hypothetical protein
MLPSALCPSKVGRADARLTGYDEHEQRCGFMANWQRVTRCSLPGRGSLSTGFLSTR